MNFLSVLFFIVIFSSLTTVQAAAVVYQEPTESTAPSVLTRCHDLAHLGKEVAYYMNKPGTHTAVTVASKEILTTSLLASEPLIIQQKGTYTHFFK